MVCRATRSSLERILISTTIGNKPKKRVFVEKSILGGDVYDFPINRSLVYGIVCCFYRVKFKREEGREGRDQENVY